MVRRPLLALLSVLLAAAGLVAIPSAAQAASYSASLSQAIADLPVAAEVRTGYSRDLFVHWVDADGDGCDTRDEVLISEAEEAPTVGSGCSLSGGRWYSYYDGVSQTSASALDIDHMVPLAEAWDSGARSWSAATRQSYANDLGDYRTLVGVTAALNRSKGDQDIAEWLPPQQQCRYLREWVAVKHRWSLSVDSAEKSAMTALVSSAGCTGTITVTVAN
ncbi:HNH endonuclease family protein [Nocardioides mangrovi]|uniref:HNH endonuclease family protein n=1 Tax=Nocardioides mangrovi TaxID=2874580 RepID=A0ABS7U9F5_9ACTN|nr:HNH endonuclease family protein [Nocardioides mangrovi]MBZ5737613.1 HNH endonuclease family protein [Nocardioides mangrovi]